MSVAPAVTELPAIPRKPIRGAAGMPHELGFRTVREAVLRPREIVDDDEGNTYEGTGGGRSVAEFRAPAAQNPFAHFLSVTGFEEAPPPQPTEVHKTSAVAFAVSSGLYDPLEQFRERDENIVLHDGEAPQPIPVTDRLPRPPNRSTTNDTSSSSSSSSSVASAFHTSSSVNKTSAFHTSSPAATTASAFLQSQRGNSAPQQAKPAAASAALASRPSSRLSQQSKFSTSNASPNTSVRINGLMSSGSSRRTGAFLPTPAGMMEAFASRSPHEQHYIEERERAHHSALVLPVVEHGDQRLAAAATEAIKCTRFLSAYPEPERRTKAKATIEHVFAARHESERRELLLANFQITASFILRELCASHPVTGTHDGHTTYQELLEMTKTHISRELGKQLARDHTERIKQLQWRHRTEVRELFKRSYPDETFEDACWITASNHTLTQGSPESSDAAVLVEQLGSFKALFTNHERPTTSWSSSTQGQQAIASMKSSNVPVCVGSELVNWLQRVIKETTDSYGQPILILNDHDDYLTANSNFITRDKAVHVAQKLFALQVIRQVNARKNKFEDAYQFFSFHPEAINTVSKEQVDAHTAALEDYVDIAVAWALQQRTAQLEAAITDSTTILQTSKMLSSNMTLIDTFKRILLEELHKYELAHGTRYESPVDITLSHKRGKPVHPFHTVVAFPQAAPLPGGTAAFYK